MNNVVYFRRSLVDKNEKEAAERYFRVIERRTAAPQGSLVIPRYSALPFNKELEEDLEAMGCQMINTHNEHVYVANLRNWYYHLAEFTPRTWFALDQIPNEGPFILKGATNSKKHLWSTHMFAKDKIDAMWVFSNLIGDGYVGVQPIYIRQYIPLKKLCDSVSDRGGPVCEEYRFFVLDGKVVTGGFYWSNYEDDINEPVDPDFVPRDFLQEVINRVAPHIRFFVVDIARTADGRWIVIELNDGQQSGLSAVDPDELYRKLSETL